MADSFIPPDDVVSAASRGLRLRKKVKAGTDVGVARARDLSNKSPVSRETIGRMASFFARHGAQKPDDIGTDADPTPWLVAWLLWGGDAGREWAERIMEAERRSEWTPDRLAPPADGTVGEDGLTHGKALRVIASGPLYCRQTGMALKALTVADLNDMARFIASRAATDPVIIGWDHAWVKDGTSLDQLLPLGVVTDARVEMDEAGRGYLVVEPAYTPHGVEVLSRARGALWPSMEWFTGPAHDRDDGRPVAPMLPVGVAVTPRPRYAPGTVDAVSLNSERPTPRGDIMDPTVDESIGAQLSAAMERLTAIEGQHGGIASRLDEIEARLKALESGDGESEAPAPADPEPAAAGEMYERSERAVASMAKRLAEVEAAAAKDRHEREFADALVSGKVQAHERAAFVEARSEFEAGRPGWFNSLFGTRAAGQFRSETAAAAAAASPRTAGKVDLAAEKLDKAKALFRSETGKDWDPKSPDFFANYNKLRSRLEAI